MNRDTCERVIELFKTAKSNIAIFIGAVLAPYDPKDDLIRGSCDAWIPEIPEGMSDECVDWLMDLLLTVARRVCGDAVKRHGPWICTMNPGARFNLGARFACAAVRTIQAETPGAEQTVKSIEDEKAIIADIEASWQIIHEIVMGLLQKRMKMFEKCAAGQEPRWDRFCFRPSMDRAVWEAHETAILQEAEVIFDHKMDWNAERRGICLATAP